MCSILSFFAVSPCKRIKMTMDGVLQNIKNLYLNPDGADVWFKIGEERIPGHKFLLSAASPWFRTMLNGSLPVIGDIPMNYVNLEVFKEFLQFFYIDNVRLTMDNIEGAIDLAAQSLNESYFQKCEKFLINNLTFDNMLLGYQLALLYEAM